jgi:glycosyltransferase involved in cell wall biosynthesis
MDLLVPIQVDKEMKLPISALIIARNEEGHIARALRSLDFVKEVIVVDAQSTDRTRELASALGAKVIVRPWTNFADQRNFSLEQASQPWVLVVDADEAVSPGLRDWLKDFFSSADAQGMVLSESAGPYGYKIRRSEYFLGKPITGACWNPSYQDRFFRRTKVRYQGEIHEYPEGAHSFVRAPAEAFLEHNPAVTVESFLQKMNHYTSIEAMDRYRQGQRTSISHMAVVFFATWWKNYFYYKGYRDGVAGFVVCLLEAVSRTVRHLKLWQLEQMEKAGRLQEFEKKGADTSSRALERSGKA